METATRPRPRIGEVLDNGATVIAVRNQEGFRTWLVVLCWYEQNQEYVVWSFNQEDGKLYFGNYFESFKEAADLFNDYLT